MSPSAFFCQLKLAEICQYFFFTLSLSNTWMEVQDTNNQSERGNLLVSETVIRDTFA